MAQLLVRNLDEDIVKKLKLRAAEKGCSAEAEHRDILISALAPKEEMEMSLLEYLAHGGPDSDFPELDKVVADRKNHIADSEGMFDNEI